MKKISLLLLLIFLVLPSFAEDSELPKWEIYCPPRFLNAQTLTPAEFQKLYPVQYLVYSQKRVDDYNKTVEYWQHRKFQFDRFVETCSNFPQDKQDACFDRLKAREVRLNEELAKLAKARINDTNAQKANQPDNHTLLLNNMLKMMNRGNMY